MKPRQKTVPIGKESEAYRPGFTNKSGRERKPEAFILGENKKRYINCLYLTKQANRNHFFRNQHKLLNIVALHFVFCAS